MPRTPDHRRDPPGIPGFIDCFIRHHESDGVNVILRKDLNAIMGTVLIIALTFLIVNIIVDLLIAVLNPRIRHSTRVQS